MATLTNRMAPINHDQPPPPQQPAHVWKEAAAAVEVETIKVEFRPRFHGKRILYSDKMQNTLSARTQSFYARSTCFLARMHAHSATLSAT
jgi:hypothetical protein